jgi:hypothetical protein
MRPPRLLLAVTALCAASALAACSGSDDPKGDESTSSATTPDSSVEANGSFERDCQAQVTVSGAVEASWEAEGTSSNQVGVTTYTSAQGPNQIVVYAGKGDIATNANLTVDGATYTTTSEDGLDVAGNGTSAQVDADLRGIDGPGPHLTATFTCD